jgi:hypothetical protein
MTKDEAGTGGASPPTGEDQTMGDRPDIITKAAWRILPIVLLCYISAFLDRVNIGFAALTMNKDLGFSASVFGFGAGIFLLGYVVCELPSNLLLVRFGARTWIARIMISWGVLSAATAFVWNPASLRSAGARGGWHARGSPRSGPRLRPDRGHHRALCCLEPGNRDVVNAASFFPALQPFGEDGLRVLMCEQSSCFAWRQRATPG